MYKKKIDGHTIFEEERKYTLYKKRRNDFEKVEITFGWNDAYVIVECCRRLRK